MSVQDGQGVDVGYCTNVHGGATLAEVIGGLDRYAAAVRARVCPEGALGIGLWLSHSAARELRDPRRLDALRETLARCGLRVFTLNGFPQGDFHAPVVKHRVYEPTWAEGSRARYTVALAHVLGRLVPEGAFGTVSTLPLGWGNPRPGDAFFDACRHQMRRVVRALARLEDRTGRRIAVVIEPEPGCIIERAGQMVAWFRSLAGDGLSDETVRRYVGVCHDVCHSAVMYEDQTRALAVYADHGVPVGKVQVSSSPAVRVAGLSGAERRRVLDGLEALAEPRYLHQTHVRLRGGGAAWFDDLPDAIDAMRRWDQRAWSEAEEVRVHFHVPVFLRQIGPLGTGIDEIGPALRAARALHGCGQFEVETYAWGVLPPEHRPASLAEGIAQELTWVRERMGAWACA